MRESYLTYEIMKRTKREAALEFRDFVFMHTVSEVPLFVLEHTKFAFDMMVLPPCSDQPPKPEVELKRFLMYATNFGLCSPLFATELFQCLQNREQKLEFESFRGFVEGLRKSRKDILEHMPMLSHIPDVQEDEAIVVYRALMLETSHRPPRMGCLLLCRHHIIFETSLFKTRHIYPYSSLRLDDNTVKLYCEKTQQAVVGGKPGATSPTDATCALDLEPIGFGEQLEKDKEFFACYLRDMMTVHMLTKKLPSNLRNVMLDDVCRRVQTDWVLYELGFPRPRVSAFYHAREEATYVRFQEKCASTFVKKRRTSFWGPLGNKPAAALDPDPEQTSSSIMPSVGNKNNEAADGADEPSRDRKSVV